MGGFDSFFKNEYSCKCCFTKAHIEQSITDYVWLLCQNCGYLYCLPPVNWDYKDCFRGDTKLKLNEDEINDLIEITLLLWDEKWFDELNEMKKKIINGWAITPVNAFSIKKENDKNETL